MSDALRTHGERSSRRRQSVVTMGVLALALWCQPSAFAQSMDYAALEQLFGEPVTTSATGSPQRAADVPADMIIVAADDIRRSGARDVSGVLAHVPGVDVLQWTSDAADVSIRGYDQSYAARTLVLIDGRQVYADYYGFVPWSTLPVELAAIRQIEIVNGPNAALFGFNAVGGVINIVTRSPAYDDTDTLEVRGGTGGLAEVSGVATFGFGSAGAVRVSAGYRNGGDFTTSIPSGMSETSRRQNDRFAADADAVIHLGDGLNLGLEASHSHARVNEMAPGYAMQNSRYETNSLKAQLTADTDLGLVKLVAYNNWIDWHGFFTSHYGTFSLGNRVTVVEAEDVFNIATDHTLRLATEYRHSTVNTAPVGGGSVHYDVVAASAMWNWRIAPSLTLTDAVRYDHYTLGRNGDVPDGYPYTNGDWNRTVDEWSFNSGVVWTATEDDTLRFIVGRGVQLPSLVQSGALLLDAGNLHVTGNPDLEMTAVTNFELAWNRRLPGWNARLQIALFRQNTDNIMSLGGNYIVATGGTYATPANVGSSDATGMELTADGIFGEGWRWSAGYRAEFLADDFLTIAEAASSLVDYAHTTPKHLLKLGLGWSGDDLEADAYLNWQSRMYGLRQTSLGYAALVAVGAYASLDARLAWQPFAWATIAVSGRNLLNDEQRQTSGAAVERSVFVTLSLNG